MIFLKELINERGEHAHDYVTDDSDILDKKELRGFPMAVSKPRP